MNRTLKMILAIITMLLMGTAFAAPVSAAGPDYVPNRTVVSSYDDQSPDSLVLHISNTTAQCEKSGGRGTVPWSSEVLITNTSSSTNVSVSQGAGRGATLVPGESVSFTVSDGGTGNAYTGSFGFLFDILDASEEAASFTINAPNPGCNEPYESPQPVYCDLLSFTDPSAWDEQGHYTFGSTLSLTAMVQDKQNLVRNIKFFATTPDGLEFVIQEGMASEVTFTVDQPGEWNIRVLLIDENGQEIPSAGDCDAVITVKAKQATAPTANPVTPVVDPPVTGTPYVGLPAIPGKDVTAVSGNGSASADTLPATGARTTFMVITGFLLIAFGTTCCYWSRKRTDPIIDPSWNKMKAVLG